MKRLIERKKIIFYNNPQFLLFSFVFLKTFLSFQTLFPANAKCRQSVYEDTGLLRKGAENKSDGLVHPFFVSYIYGNSQKRKGTQKNLYMSWPCLIG